MHACMPECESWNMIYMRKNAWRPWGGGWIRRDTDIEKQRYVRREI
jgi:hypothetical protein